MTNQERLEKYLVGNNGYLKSDISNGKVIMLSGKWGSGKTHFWKNIIEKNLKSEKIPNNYISLYGKTSIQEIKNEVFLKIFEGMDIFKIDDKSVNLAKNTANLIADFTKTVSVFGVNLDLSKIVDKSFEKLDEVRKNQKEEKTKALLNSGAIICFDDFERKSKDIDLNDLFGFITQLTLNFSCKVVIILNDDVFEGEEKKIFSRVKEKSVSKFLKYEPSIEELFETIFSIERYRVLDEHKEIILNTIIETKELNARIYIQILDNLVEWIEKEQENNDEVLRCLILVNINFILYHKILEFFDENSWEDIIRRYKIKDFNVDYELELIFRDISKDDKKEYVLENLISNISKSRIDENNSEVKINNKINFIKTYKTEIISIYFAFSLNMAKNISKELLNKINNFIETGILINE